MAGPSADERIKRFLKRRAQESALAEVARQEHRERERQEHDELSRFGGVNAYALARAREAQRPTGSAISMIWR